MKLASVSIEAVEFRLLAPLQTARGALEARRGFNIRVRSPSGRAGVGEALPLPEFGTESLDACAAALADAASSLGGQAGDLDAFLDALEQDHPDTPAARAGLDVALHDLEAREQSRRIADLLGPSPRAQIEVNGLAPCPVFRQRGYRTLKCKIEHDLAPLVELRREIGAKIQLRADANGCWSVREAHAQLAQLESCALEFVEQPLAAAELTDLAELAADSKVEIAADESLSSAEGRALFADGKLARIGVLKIPLLGGLRPAARLARAATASGADCVITTALEGPIGTAAALQLAAAVGDPKRAHGLSACDWVEAPFPVDLIPRDGRLFLPRAAGLGWDFTR